MEALTDIEKIVVDMVDAMKRLRSHKAPCPVECQLYVTDAMLGFVLHPSVRGRCSTVNQSVSIAYQLLEQMIDEDEATRASDARKDETSKGE